MEQSVSKRRSGWLRFIFQALGPVGQLAIAIVLFTSEPALWGRALAQDSASEPPGADQSYGALVARAMIEFRNREFTKAYDSFSRAHALEPSARTWRGLGVSAFQLRDYTKAKRDLEQALADRRQPLNPAQRRGARELLDWIRDSLAVVDLDVVPGDARVTVDDLLADSHTLLLEPGEHDLRASASGYAPLERKIALSDVERRTFRLELTPLQGEPPVAAPVAAASEPVPPPPRDAPGPAISREATREISRSPTHRESPLYELWWFWTAVSGGVIAVVLASIALTTKSHHGDAPPVDAVATALRYRY